MTQMYMEIEDAPRPDFEPTLSGVVGSGPDAHRIVRVSTWTMRVWAACGDGEPRVRDLDLASRLGFDRPRDVRKLIERIWPENKRPINRATVARWTAGKGAKREEVVHEYWLTEAQALKLIARSETAVAEAILDEMIAVYIAARRGLLAPVSTPPPVPATPPLTLDDVRRAAEAVLASHLASLADAIGAHASVPARVGAPPPHSQSPEPRRRPAPGGAGSRPTLRNARHYFRRRERRWRSVPAGVTWEAWLASDEGRRWCRDRGIDDPHVVPR